MYAEVLISAVQFHSNFNNKSKTNRRNANICQLWTAFWIHIGSEEPEILRICCNINKDLQLREWMERVCLPSVVTALCVSKRLSQGFSLVFLSSIWRDARGLRCLILKALSAGWCMTASALRQFSIYCFVPLWLRHWTAMHRSSPWSHATRKTIQDKSANCISKAASCALVI